MKWEDQALILGKRTFGENKFILTLFSHHHGKRKGLSRFSKNHMSFYQTGNLVEARWQGRLEEQLGTFVLEPYVLTTAHFLGHPKKLAGIISMCSILEASLADHHPYPRLYEASVDTVNTILGAAQDEWLYAYSKFELFLLQNLGFGLDLSSCVVTGEKHNLMYVSPKTGKAVSAAASKGLENKLLLHPQNPCQDELKTMLQLSEYFIKKHFFEPQNRLFPKERSCLIS